MKEQIVHLFIFDTLADWEPGFAVAGINKPAFQTQPGRYSIKTVGLQPTPVKTMGGITLLPDLTLDQLAPAQSAMLILPGGDSWDEGQNLEAAQKAKDFLAAGIPVAAICGATSGLARAGLLDDKPHTSNALEYLQATNYQGAALYQNEPAVTGGNLITAGATAPLDFAYHIFKKLDLYPAETLEAWYGLYKTGDPSYFFKLMEASAQ
jgi:putative intracellular protease/amidase